MNIDFIEMTIKEAYRLTDIAVEKQLKEKNIKYVCSKGCSVCCEDMELDVLKFEMDVIKYHFNKMKNDEIKRGLIENINKFRPNQRGCPFLVNKCCGIYDVRPLVCRVYFMKNKKCTLGENILETRFEDNVSFDSLELFEAIKGLYILYKFKDSKSFRKALYKGFLMENVSSLYDFDIKGFISE